MVNNYARRTDCPCRAPGTAREVDPEDLPVLDPYAGTKRPRKTAGTLIPAPDAPSAEENADDPFGGDDA